MAAIGIFDALRANDPQADASFPAYIEEGQIPFSFKALR